MSILKYMRRAQRINSLIEMRSTGTPEQFADKMKVSRSTLLEHLRELKTLGGNIEYDRHNQSYVYRDDRCLEIGYNREKLPE